MKKLLMLPLFVLFILTSSISFAQCTWQPLVSDGFEYQTVCPDIIPGTTYHVIPQTYAVHSGTYALYMNFINCNGGTGVCAGDTFYIRTLDVCPNMPIRITSWFTTVFNSPQSDIHVVITDGSGVVLNNQLSVVTPLAPNWVLYNSGSITPTTGTITMTLITNIDGGNGNDLGMDDFLMERCFPTQTSTSTPGKICSNSMGADLFTFIPGNPDTTGAWTGPSTLAGGFAGTYSTQVNQPGFYVYSTTPYGTGTGCPAITDSINVAIVPAPAPQLGNDTVLCLNQTLLLTPGTSPAYSYIWNNGATTSTLTASTLSTGNDTVLYTVHVTDFNGCENSDSILIVFEVCNSIEESPSSHSAVINVSASTGVFHVKIPSWKTLPCLFSLSDAAGKIIISKPINEMEMTFYLPQPISGVYFYSLTQGAAIIGSGHVFLFPAK